MKKLTAAKVSEFFMIQSDIYRISEDWNSDVGGKT